MKSIPKGWIKTKLVDIATVQTGLSKSAARQGEFVSRPYLRVANVQDGHLDLSEVKYIDVPVAQQERFRLVSGDLLLTEGGDFDKLGRGCLWKGEIDDCVHQNHVFAVRVKEASLLTPSFLALLIQSDRSRAYFVSCAKQTTNLASINSSQLKQLPVLLPPVAEQYEILRMIDECRRGIDTAAALLDALERRKQGLMQQLLTGRRRLKGFKGTWKSVRVGSFAVDVRSINTAGHTLPVLSCTKYAGLVDSLKYFNKQVFSENTTTYKSVKRGQFVYATNHIEEGSIGYQDLCDAALVSPMYTVFEPDAAVINHQFLYMLLKTEAMRRVFEATTHSSVDRRGSLRWPEFAKLKINIPPMPEQERIVEVLTAASGAADLAKQQLDELKTQKRALMQKLLSGEWRLPESPMQGKSSSKKGL
ncbi:MAG: restriction endonuclease subunit S [Polaromonas sp.]|uniref:restriction endonuclease subunit S n=1 Tax=Polaromonas sp. TaxID=1869339 RepID=UPI002734CB4A|nr:restriction endonuclease subunit S [Polaromonas sp.]MDP2820013.1 restriction endonuclease subunit S [Polaromonas sp.]